MIILKTTFLLISILGLCVGFSVSQAQAAGLPQLDIATYPPQLIWLVITFAALLTLMSRVSLPRISQVLEERQHKIEDNLKKAESYREDAAIAAKSYTKAQEEARTNAYAIIIETHKRIAMDIAEKQEELSEKLEKEINVAEDRIQAAKEVAMAAIDKVATDVALNTTEKILGETLNKKDVSKVISEVLEDRQ